MSDRRVQLLKAKRSVLLAKDSLTAFARYMRPDPRFPNDPEASLYEVEPVHAFMGAQLEKLERGEIKRLILSLPPRTGKSELAQKTFVPWVMGRNPYWHVITATYNSDFAEDFGRAVRDLLQHPRFQNVFPGVKLKYGAQAVSRLETERGSIATFVGRGGSLTGRGGHLLVIDDPLKDRKEADSPTIRKDLWDWYNQVFATRVMTDEARMLIIQTRWHDDDLVGRLTNPNNDFYRAQEASRWTVINIPALAEEDDPLGRSPGEPLRPKVFSVAHLAQMRDNDPRGFSALYQGQPAPDEGLFFGPQDIVEYQSMEQFPGECVMNCASDHAVSTEQWADKTALLVFGIDDDEDIWLHPDTVLRRIGSQEAVQLMLNMIHRHKPRYWWAESGHISKSIGPFLRKRMAEERAFTSLIELTPIKDKQTRAQSIKGRMSMRKVHFPSFAPWYGEARNQLLTFPAGPKDDFVDALSMIGLGMQLHYRASTAPKRDLPKEGTFGQMFAETRARERMLGKTNLPADW